MCPEKHDDEPAVKLVRVGDQEHVRIKPNFLIIGVPRSATTYLSRNASEHPEIFVASRLKHGPGDVPFSDVSTSLMRPHNSEKGLEWYWRLFEGATTERAVGEKTARYLCDPKAPELIRHHLPAVRMIAVLRDPVERAYSAYRYFRGAIPSSMGFLDACYSDSTKPLMLLEAGFYHEQVMRYLGHFDRSQFLFLLYDDLQTDPLGSVQRVYTFLGVDATYVPSGYQQRVNVTLHRGAAHHLRSFALFLKQKSPRLHRLLKPAVPMVEEIIGLGSRAALADTRYPQMSPQDRAELRAVYLESDQKLSAFLDRDLIALWHERRP